MIHSKKVMINFPVPLWQKHKNQVKESIFPKTLPTVG